MKPALLGVAGVLVVLMTAGNVALASERLQLDRLPVLLGPGQRLVLSGSAQERPEGQETVLWGQVRADEGVIEIRSAFTPRLAMDVQVRAGDIAESRVNDLDRAERRARDLDRAEHPTSDGRIGLLGGSFDRSEKPVRTELRVDLGERFKVYGQGMDARLQGEVSLTLVESGWPRMHGTVQVCCGIWRGFGRDLPIEQGTLRFTGDPEDPAIDIVAWRRHQPVAAGVRLTGTARHPVLTLLSWPEVPEPDKLSWLVLGKAFDTTRGEQNAALQAAAALVMTSADRASPVRSLNSSFGLERLSIRTAPAGASDTFGAEGFAQDSIVTLGRRLTERLFLSYEQSVRGLQNLVRLQYQITQNLALRLRAGSQTGIDLNWTRRED